MPPLITAALWLIPGTLLTFFILPPLMQNVFRDVFVAPGLDVQDFVTQGPPSLFAVFWFCNVLAVLFWLWRTSRRRAASAKKVAAMRDQWWLAARLLPLAGLLCLVFQIWIPFPQISLPGVILLFVLLLVDEALLFWLPTVFASGGSYRFVAPGAQRFRKK